MEVFMLNEKNIQSIKYYNIALNLYIYWYL